MINAPTQQVIVCGWISIPNTRPYKVGNKQIVYIYQMDDICEIYIIYSYILKLTPKFTLLNFTLLLT